MLTPPRYQLEPSPQEGHQVLKPSLIVVKPCNYIVTVAAKDFSNKLVKEATVKQLTHFRK